MPTDRSKRSLDVHYMTCETPANLSLNGKHNSRPFRQIDGPSDTPPPPRPPNRNTSPGPPTHGRPKPGTIRLWQNAGSAFVSLPDCDVEIRWVLRSTSADESIKAATGATIRVKQAAVKCLCHVARSLDSTGGGIRDWQRGGE
jgi:hypothetical protein